MNSRNSPVRTTACSGLMLGLVFNLTACAGIPGLGGTAWQEEVLLHDGSKIVVDRSVKRGGRHEIGQRPSYTSETLAFRHPTTGVKIVWEDKATPDLGNSNFLPMALDIYQDKVFLVVSPMGCIAYNKWGRPNPPYVVFRYDNTWKRVPLEELPPETKSLNLIFSSPDTAVEKLGGYLVDAATVAQINAGLSQTAYKSILRDSVKDPVGRCGEMIYDGRGGWIGIGWFRKQPSIEACMKYCGLEKISVQYCPCETIFKYGE